MPSPFASQPKHLKKPFSLSTLKEADFSLWKGQSPHKSLPLLRNST